MSNKLRKLFLGEDFANEPKIQTLVVSLLLPSSFSPTQGFKSFTNLSMTLNSFPFQIID